MNISLDLYQAVITSNSVPRFLQKLTPKVLYQSGITFSQNFRIILRRLWKGCSVYHPLSNTFESTVQTLLGTSTWCLSQLNFIPICTRAVPAVHCAKYNWLFYKSLSLHFITTSYYQPGWFQFLGNNLWYLQCTQSSDHICKDYCVDREALILYSQPRDIINHWSTMQWDLWSNIIQQ